MLTTAVISALVALATRSSDWGSDVVFAITVFALLALLALGVSTLLRMIKRNRVTDGYKRAMAQIRAFFKAEDDRLQEYEPFPPTKRKVGSGGLTEMVVVFNALIIAALGIVLGTVLSLWVASVLGALGFVIALILQFRFIAGCYAEK
ncbi:MAG: hypothetical protein N2559_15355 [Anaerolineae bacterium]|nr:hypothetical protein [Anaerolineae bacterium]